MGYRVGLICLALVLVAAAASADILPEPDHGPPMGSAGGLDFAIQSVRVERGALNGPRYYKTLQVAVLNGCIEGKPNCNLAKSRNLIGMEVVAVDGKPLRPEIGMVRQIIDAFANQEAALTVTLELFSRASNNEPVKVSFARH